MVPPKQHDDRGAEKEAAHFLTLSQHGVLIGIGPLGHLVGALRIDKDGMRDSEKRMCRQDTCRRPGSPF